MQKGRILHYIRRLSTALSTVLKIMPKAVLKIKESSLAIAKRALFLYVFTYCARYSSRQRPESLMSFACSLPT